MSTSQDRETAEPAARRDVTALLVVDLFGTLQGGDGRALRRNAPKTLPAIADLIRRARTAKVPVIYTQQLQGRWGDSEDELVRGAHRDGYGDLLSGLEPEPDDPFLTRARPSAFDHSPLEDVLHARGVRRIVLAGQVTEQAILYSALDASVRRLGVVIPKDAVVSIEPPLATAALRMMDRNMHAEITTSASVNFASLGAPQPSARVPRLAPTTPSLPGPVDGDGAAPSETRQQLLNALAVVIARQGFSGTKVADIAREARTSLRTFYAEFPSKEECFLALHWQLTEIVVNTVRKSIVFDRPWIEVMRGGFQSYFNLLMAQPQLTHAILVELATLSPEARRAREEAMQMFAEMLCELVEDGRRANPDIPSRPLPLQISRGIIGAFMELIISHVDRGDTDQFPALIDTTTEMLASVVVLNVSDVGLTEAVAPATGQPG